MFNRMIDRCGYDGKIVVPETDKPSLTLRLALWIVVIILQLQCVAGAAAIETVAYQPRLGAKSPLLDIYPVSGPGKAPVMIYVHGGAWQRGSRRQVGSKPDHFRRNGFVFISIDYRLVPEVSVEDQLNDVDQALGWIDQNIDKYGGDRRNLHLMGHSAGAYLVSMIGVKPGRHSARLISNGALRTVISNDTLVYDIPRVASTRGGKLHTRHEAALGTDKQRWRRLSPRYHIGGRTTYPAFLIIYSGQGLTRLRKVFAEDFAASLKEAEVEVTVYNGSQYSHRQVTTRIGWDNDLTRYIDRLLGQNVAKSVKSK